MWCVCVCMYVYICCGCMYISTYFLYEWCNIRSNFFWFVQCVGIEWGDWLNIFDLICFDIRGLVEWWCHWKTTKLCWWPEQHSFVKIETHAIKVNIWKINVMVTLVFLTDGQNLSWQGSDNDLLCHYHQKHSTMNLLRVNEEGDETSEEEMKA